MSDADDLADLLAELTVSLVVELHPAIADLVMPGHFRPAGAPAAAVFLRPLEGEPTHPAARRPWPWPSWPPTPPRPRMHGWAMAAARAIRSCRVWPWPRSTWSRPGAAARSGWAR